jgi:hypothetical protein
VGIVFSSLRLGKRLNSTSANFIQALSSSKVITYHSESFVILVYSESLKGFVLPEGEDGAFSFRLVFSLEKFLIQSQCFCLYFLHQVVCFSFTQDLSLLL